MKTEICLLDVDYQEIDGDVSIILYGRSADKKRVVVVDPNYEPYFYVLPKNLAKAKKEVEAALKKENMEVKRIEEADRILLGEEKEFIKIYCFMPQETTKVRDAIKVLEEKRGGSGSILEEYEYQMGFYRSYLADLSISSLQWLAVEGEPFKTEFDADLVVKARTIKKTDKESIPFKVLALDTEVVEEKRGERQLVMISLYGEEIQKVLTYKKGKFPIDVEVVKDEKELLSRFVESVKRYDPDIITGYNSDLYDFDVIRERATKLRVKLDDLSVDSSGVTLSKRARVSAARLKGRVHVDLFHFINNILASILQTEVLSLDAVSAEILGDEKIEMEYAEIVEAWTEEKNLGKLAQYCLKDSELTFRLSEVLLPQIFQLTKIVGQSLFDTSRMMYGQLVEWTYTRKAKEMGRIVPNQPKFEEIQKRQHETYTGGYVKEPEAGLHENIAVIDFASLYPSISSTYNISVETLNCSCCKKDGYRVPELPFWFCKRREGFESRVVRDLLAERETLKKELKKLALHSLAYNLINTRQMALKTVANASYGYYGFPASKWYSKECAESITAFGRHWIKRIMEEAERKGFQTLYGDTDSAFLGLGKKGKKELLNLLETLNKELPGIMHIELEGFYHRGIFIPREVGGGVAKKRYALIDKKGSLKIRGLEKVRRDWSNLAKEMQEGILKLILGKKDVEAAVKLVKEGIKGLKNLKVELRDLAVYEQLTKPIGEYKLISPHISAAKKLTAKGIPVNEGSVVGFVIEKGSGSISEKAQPIEFTELKRIDIDYYIHHQILPASLRILKVLGVDEKELLNAQESSLF
ncbi:MAG TPA: DNA-directed DNA polymerase [Thermodesulfobacteriota bacterium]|nr:DNA-directed DNA polymerase [Thermodesulfobacteriota bacterium]